MKTVLLWTGLMVGFAGISGCEQKVPEACKRHIAAACKLCGKPSSACRSTKESIELGRRRGKLSDDQCKADLAKHRRNVAYYRTADGWCKAMAKMDTFNNAR